MLLKYMTTAGNTNIEESSSACMLIKCSNFCREYKIYLFMCYSILVSNHACATVCLFIYSAIANSVGLLITETPRSGHEWIKDYPRPYIMMLLMYMSWGKLWKDWEIIRLLAMMEFHLKFISLHLSDCWWWCQYSFPVACLYWYATDTLMHVVTIR